RGRFCLLHQYAYLGQKAGQMSLVIKDKVFEQLTEGLHNVTITRIEDLGLQETQFGTKDRAAIYFTASDQKEKKGKAVVCRMGNTIPFHSKAEWGKRLNTPRSRGGG